MNIPRENELARKYLELLIKEKGLQLCPKTIASEVERIAGEIDEPIADVQMFMENLFRKLLEQAFPKPALPPQITSEQ